MANVLVEKPVPMSLRYSQITHGIEPMTPSLRCQRQTVIYSMVYDDGDDDYGYNGNNNHNNTL
jgi:hypothetical protein